MDITCSKCKEVLEIPEFEVGKMVKCPFCGNEFVGRKPGFFESALMALTTVKPNAEKYTDEAAALIESAFKCNDDADWQDKTEKAAVSMLIGFLENETVECEILAKCDAANDAREASQLIARAPKAERMFRRVVLANYNNQCCLTKLNVPETLEACVIDPGARNSMMPLHFRPLERHLAHHRELLVK